MSLPPDETPTRADSGRPASERVRDADFPLVMRGYDRRAVDEYVTELIDLVDELEGRQLREKVVQRALDEVGEQTAGILQHAHETADELAARSRAQAEGRIQRAEREAEIAKTDADAYAQEVVVDTRLLWEQRQALLDDIRRLADEVLATAEEAVERLTLPDAVADAANRSNGAEPTETLEVAAEALDEPEGGPEDPPGRA
ncbi:MAG: DivIVA domain-containing protein [Thermoleophilaceae bacterium]|nr:DivIVA domain-containing protein [Thermoleophilaceae bacterium]